MAAGYAHIAGVAIAATNLAARGPDGPVFDGVDLDVPPGGLGAVVGTGGSGRSALLLALAGRFEFASGRVRVGRHQLPGSGEAAVKEIRRLVAVARTRPAVDLDGALSVRALVSERRGLAIPGVRDVEVTRAFEQAGLTHVPPGSRTRVESLPAPDRTLLAVALALLERPSALVVDDVDSGATPTEQASVWAILRELADAGGTVIASAVAPPPGGLADATVELSHPEAPATEQPATEQPATEQPATKQPDTEPSAPDQDGTPP